MKKFDFIVIGGGSGLNVASAAAKKGLAVAVIEKGPLGGTCLNRGCIPSKMLIHSADLAEEIKRAHLFGIQASIESIDFPFIMKRTLDFVDEEAKGIEEAILSAPQYTLYKGEAYFTSPKTIKVGGEEIEGERILIAAGTRPFVPPIPGIDKTPHVTSDDFFRLERKPSHAVFIGGGYISCELAHFLGGLGTKVTIVDRGPLLISNEDEEIAQRFTEIFGKKYQLVMNATTKSVGGQEGAVTVEVESNGKNQKVEGDLLVVATGRISNADALKLAEVGYKLSEKGFLEVNEYMETNIPGVWALGDIVGKAPFKHGANWEAKHVAINVFSDQKTAVDYAVLPHAVFSSPQIAGVGLREQDLKAKGADYTVGRYDYIKTGMGKALEETDGFAKILVDKSTQRIVGAFIMGAEASTLIHEIAVALKTTGGDLSAIKDTIHIHPALSEVVQRAVNAVSLEGPLKEVAKTLMERTTDQEI